MGLTATEQDAAIAGAFRNGTSSLEDEKHSQASYRFFRIFTDQWGREYGADCEKKTQHPCGPYAARYEAPIYPPAKYMVITDTIRARVVVDTHRWISDLLEEHDMYWQEVHTWAAEKSGVKALELYDRQKGWVDPQLLPFVGKPPMPVSVIQAMRAGNPWILGLLVDGKPAPKPKGAPRDYFPDAEQMRERDPFRERDPWAEEGATPAGTPPTKNTAAPDSYPHMYAPSRWWLSAQHRDDCLADKRAPFVGKKAAAIEAAKAGTLPPEISAPKIDPSWEE